MKILLIILAACLACATADKVSYKGYKVYRVQAENEEQNYLLTYLQNNAPDLDFWKGGTRVGLYNDIMVRPDQQEGFIAMMHQYGMNPEVYIEDVEEKLSEEIVGTMRANMTWDKYYKLDDIYDWMDSLPQANPGIVVHITLGKSYEGRDIKGLKITYGSGRRGIFFEGQLHAREWITAATLTYVINEVLTNQDPEFRRVVESFDWYIFPMINPDGYVYSHETDRLWRKTRSRHGNCFGVDPNRNFDFYWGQFGASSDPCSTTYAGPRAFSEDETNFLRNYVTLLAKELDVYMSFHSYGQLFLIPYGNTTDHIGNYDDLKTIATSGITAIRAKHGKVYRTGNSAEILYTSSGTSKDWAKAAHNISIVYTVELRDTGTNGFVLPPAEILPNNEEMMDGLIAMLKEGERLGYFTIG